MMVSGIPKESQEKIFSTDFIKLPNVKKTTLPGIGCPAWPWWNCTKEL